MKYLLHFSENSEFYEISAKVWSSKFYILPISYKIVEL